MVCAMPREARGNGEGMTATPQIELLNVDCMAYMRTLADKAFDLAIADPPYGLGKSCWGGAGHLKNRLLQIEKKKIQQWDIRPTQEYFDELFRVSKNQIIFGGNFFPLPPSRGIVAWDKAQPWKNFSQFELIWTSFNKPSALFRLGNNREKKIHPTQKPVALYKWLLERYAKSGERILDTHLGSGSIALACQELGFDFVGCEIDSDYFEGARRRFLEQFKKSSEVQYANQIGDGK